MYLNIRHNNATFALNMGELKKYKIIPDASDRILPECSPNEFLGASGFFNSYKNLNSKIVKQMLETPAEIVSNINATSSVQFEMAFKIFNKNEQIYTNT